VTCDIIFYMLVTCDTIFYMLVTCDKVFIINKTIFELYTNIISQSVACI